MFRRAALGAVASALLLTQPAFAHHPTAVSGSGGAGPIYTISASTLDKGQSAASIFFEYTRLNELSDATLLNGALSGDHVHSLRTIETAALSYAYGVTNDLTASVRLPFVQRTDIREGHQHDPTDPPEIHFRGDASGVGDVTLLGQYRFYNNRASQTEAALLFGVKAPTGETSVTDPQGEGFDAEFQPGSGSWDGLFGVAVTKRFGAWSFDSNVLYVLTGKGTQDTDLGDRVLYNAALSYRLFGSQSSRAERMRLGAAPEPLPEPMYHGGPTGHTAPHAHDGPPPLPTGPALDLVLELNGEWHGKQVEAGEKDPNSGGNTIYLSPGLRLSKDKWSAFVSVGLPVLSDLNGVQAGPDYRIATGLSFSF